MNVPNNNLIVRIWDLGPKSPELPQRPVHREAKSGSSDEILAESDFNAAMSIYEASRADYARLKREYDRWHHLNGGPYQIEMWSVNAIEAMERDPERYVRALPKGVKPGKAHLENERRRAEEQAEIEVLRDRDPQFGRGAAA